MHAKRYRLRWPAGFWNVAGPIFIVLAMTHQGALPPPSYIGSDNERAGFGVTTQISNFDVSLLNGGWFVRWDVQPAPAEPAGYIYMPMLRVTGSTFIPSGVELAAGVANNLGRTWIIGNEADNIWQDNVLPQDYAVAYHDAYFFIKQRDPTAQIAINGVTQGTPLRLQWLDLVWNSYRARYGSDMPVDVWNMHTFVLREQINSWGASIPPGVNATQGMLWEIDDHDRVDLVQEQVIRFRRWMKDHGQQNKPLINTEYGILMPINFGFDYARVTRFLNGTFDLFNSLRDPTLGMPEDDYRLLQRWCWFSLDSEQFEGQYVRSLFNHSTRQLTPIGQAFAAWGHNHRTWYSDLQISAGPTYSATWAVFAEQPSRFTLNAAVSNTGNLATGPFAVRFGLGSPDQVAPPIGEAALSAGLPARHSPPGNVQVAWEQVVSQTLTVFAQADSYDMVREFHENDNTKTMTVTPPVVLDLKLSDLHTTPRSWPLVPPTVTVTVPLSVDISNIGGRGVSGDLEVQFWQGRPDIGAHLGSVILNAQNAASLPVIANFAWPNVAPGVYRIYAYIPPAPDDADVDNNQIFIQVSVPVARTFLPAIRRR